MNVYAESSAVLAWVFSELRGDEIRRILAGSQLILSSRLTMVECDRALIHARATGRLTEGEANDRRQALTGAFVHWHLLRLDDEILERSRLPFPGEPLRALDALHLSSALLSRAAVRGLALLSLDSRVRASGAALGFDLLPA